MDEKMEMIIFEMISAAGGARSKYIEAISAAKAGEFENAQKLIDEGNEFFSNAHNGHADMLTNEASGVNSTVTLLLVHAEDQMMCAEAFRTIAAELIDVYKKINL